MSMAQPSVASGRQRIAVTTQIPFQRLFRLAVLCPTTGFTFWMVVWSLLRLGLLGSFTSLVLGLGEGIWVAGGGVGEDFLGLGGVWRVAARLIRRIRWSGDVERSMRRWVEGPRVVALACR